MQKRWILFASGSFVIVFVLIMAGMLNQIKKEKFEKQEVQNRESVELTLWYPWANENQIYQKAMQDAIAEFHSEQKFIHITAEGIDTEVYREKLPSAVAMDETPDIYFCYASTYLNNIVQTGKVLRLNRYLGTDIREYLRENALETVTFQEGIYGLPYAEDYGVFLVNTELFEKYACQIPQNWEELINVCEIFRKNGMIPLACSTDMDTGFRMYLEMLCLSEAGKEECGRIISQKESPNEAFLNGVQKFCTLLEMNAFGQRDVQKSTFDVEEDFTLSRIPMYFTKNRILGDIMQKNNPLYGKIKLVPFPNGKNSLLGGISEVFVVDASTQYPQEAVCALEIIMQKFSVKLYEKGAAIPAWEIENIKAPEESLYEELLSQVQNTQQKMLYWEFILNGRGAMHFMENTESLYFGQISTEEFWEKQK